MFVLHLLALSLSCVSTVLKFTVIIFSMSMLGITDKACPFPGTTKNLLFFGLLIMLESYFAHGSCLTAVLLYILIVCYYFWLLPIVLLLL